MKRIAIIADTHCGSIWGLAPPEYKGGGERAENIRYEMWDAYIDTLKMIKPFYAVILNSDLIDGRNDKSGGQELISGKMKDQIEIAEKCIKELECDNLYFSSGTPYHVGREENFEEILAQRFGKTIDKIIDLDIDGWQVNAKHHIGRSIIPHGRFTPGARAQLWNALQADTGNYPKSDIIIRCLSHDTEILTKNGWMKYDEINKQNFVLTLNIKNNKLEWNKVNHIIKNNDYKEMINIKAKGYDTLITSNHTMIYLPMSSETYLKNTADQLNKMSTFRLPVSGYIENKDIDISDGLLKTLAWVIAEGNIDSGNLSKGYKEKNNVRLFQNESRAYLIENVLNDAKIEYTKHLRKQKGYEINDFNGKKYYTKEDGIVFYLRQPYSREIIKLLNGEKNIPDFLMDMSNRQFELFIDEYIKGDGYLEKKEGIKKQGKIFTSNKLLADKLQILLLSNGYKTNISERSKWNKINYVIHFVKKQYITIVKKQSFKKIKYNNFTWCISVENNTIVIRRNGKVAIVGNSHVHYYTQGRYSKKIMITTPCLQAPFTIYGDRCDGIVNLGLLYIDFEPKEDKKHIRQLPFVQEVNFDNLESLKVIAKKI